MKAIFYSALFAVGMFLFPNLLSGQIPDLGTTSSFALFTAVGAFNNTGATMITGDIGTNVGAFTGFPPGVVIGNVHVADGVSATAATDVDLAYTYLDGLTCGAVIGTTLGNGQMLLPNIYCLGAASVIEGNLTLDGGGNPNAQFIFQIDGALSTAVLSNVFVINGANLCNVYWQVNGAVELGEGSSFRGTIVGNGAITLLEGATLVGRGLTRQGAINLSNNNVSMGLAPVAGDIAADGAVSFCDGDSVVLSGNMGGTWSTGETTESITVFTSGDFYVFYASGCGVDTSNHIIVDAASDIVPPTITCPPDLTLECDESTLTLSTGTATATDECDSSPIVSYSESISDGSCLQAYSITRIWTATDIAGNASSCTQVISIEDTNAPTITCPSVLSPISCDAIPEFGTPTVTDVCGGMIDVTFVTDSIPGSCGQAYSLIRTWTAIDDCGNSASCSVTIEVLDLTAPVLTCPVVVSPLECGTIPDFGVATATDLCDPSIDITIVTDSIPGNCAQAYTLIRTWTATDDCGNTSVCSATIVVLDNTDPVITCPPDVSGTCLDSTDPLVTGFATATDNCDGAPFVFYFDVMSEGNCPVIITRTWSSMDECGNVDLCTQLITLTDDTPPVLICPLVISPIDCGSTPVFGIATATDLCDPSVAITFVTDSVVGSCGPTYSLTRTWTATDECGNTATCSATIVVQDITAPLLTCPTVMSPLSCGAIPEFGVPTVTDACDALVDVTFVTDSIPGSCDQSYTLIRTWTAIDDCGNSSTCSVTIEVQDLTPPVLICPVVVSPLDCGSIPNFSVATATDLCDPIVDITIVTDSIPGGCAEAYTLIRTWTATDDCGNSAVCSATIIVQDNTAPVLSCPTVVSPIPCGTTPDFGTATATDLCDALVTVTFLTETMSGGCEEDVTMIRTWTATDDCGNTATCSATIILQGNTAPVILCPANLTVGCATEVPVVNTADVTISVICGTATVTHLGDVISNQICENQYILTRTYQVIDVCGTVTNCTQIITVSDLIPPDITFLNSLFANGDTIHVQCYGQDPEWDLPAFNADDISTTDICGGTVDVSFLRTLLDEGDCEEDGYIRLFQLTWTATDECGNSSTAYMFYDLVDTIAPVIFGVPDDITINCNDLPEPPPLVYALDECLCACVMFFEDVPVFQGCVNGLVVVRTWTAIDDCGNKTIETQQITLIDTEGPQLIILEPEIAGITDGTVLEYDCLDGGIPSFFDTLDGASVISPGSCGGGDIITFSQNMVVSNNCEFFGYLEQRTYRWTAIDLCGFRTELTIFVRLIDTIPPVMPELPEMTCFDDPALLNMEAEDQCGQAFIRFWDIDIPNPCGDGTAVRRMYEAYDECGNFSEASVILLPNVGNPPVIILHQAQMSNLLFGETIDVVCADYGSQYTSFGVDDVSATGLCESEVDIQFAERLLETGDCILDHYVALVELKWTATDLCGNHSEIIVLAKIIDQTPPVFISFKPEITIGCDVAIPPVLAHDPCGDVVVTYSDIIINGDCIYEYDIRRTVTATDLCGNTSTRLQIVHVGNGSGPVIEGVVEEICDDLTIPVVTAFDVCAQVYVEVFMVQDTLDVTCRDGLVIRRIWSATDICGHTSTITQIIIFNDHTPPSIYAPTYSVIHQFIDRPFNLVYQSQKDIIAKLNLLDMYTVSVYDDCDQLITAVFSVDTIFAEDCEEEGYSQRRTYTWLATDICGNTASLFFVVDIMDDVSPVFSTVPSDTTLVCVPFPEVQTMEVIDTLEDVVIVFTESVVPGTNPGEFLITRTWIVTDSCGNSTQYIQIITWIPESLMACEIVVPDEIECNSHGVIIVSNVIGGSGLYTYDWIVVGEECFIQGGQGTPEVIIYVGWSEVKVILTVTDSFGCVSMCMVFLNCVDTEVFPFIGSPSLISTDGVILESPAPGISVSNTDSEENLTELNIWPNPTAGTVYLSFETKDEGRVEYSFINYLGQRMLGNMITAGKGLNTQQIDVTKIPQGSYLMQVKTETEIYTKVVVIMRND